MNTSILGRWTKPGRVLMAGAVACVVAGAGIVPAAHASRAHANINVTLWADYNGADRDAFIGIVNGFNSSGAGVTVTYDQQNLTGYGTKVTTALSAGKGPNMWVGDNVQMAGWAGQNQLATLDSAIKGSKVITAKNFGAGAWAGTKFQGHTYSLPLDALPMTMYYNKALFRKAKLNPNKPPTTTPASFLATARKLTHGSQYGFLVPNTWPIFLMYTSVLYQFGGRLFDVKTKKAQYASTAGYKALKALYDLTYKYKVSPANTAIDTDMKILPTGGAAMAVDGPWQVTNASIKAMGADAGIAAFPQIGPKKAVAFYSHYLVAYTKNTAAENKAIVKFAEYYNKHSLELAKVGDQPMYKPVINSKAMKSLKAVAPVSGMMKYAIAAGPTFSKYNDSHLWDDVVIPALQGKLKPAQFKAALRSAADKTDQAAQGD